jgi:hypothetical protein
LVSRVRVGSAIEAGVGGSAPGRPRLIAGTSRSVISRATRRGPDISEKIAAAAHRAFNPVQKSGLGNLSPATLDQLAAAIRSRLTSMQRRPRDAVRRRRPAPRWCREVAAWRAFGPGPTGRHAWASRERGAGRLLHDACVPSLTPGLRALPGLVGREGGHRDRRRSRHWGGTPRLGCP